MEAAIICEGFMKSIEMYGLIYGNVIGDGDSSTYSKSSLQTHTPIMCCPDMNEEEFKKQRHPFERLKDLVKDRKSIENRQYYNGILLAKQENIEIKPCGLFIDPEIDFLGASPDGIVGDDTVVEVKCPVAANKKGMRAAITENKIQILRYNKKTGNTTINKNSDWYFQAQVCVGTISEIQKYIVLTGVVGTGNRYTVASKQRARECAIVTMYFASSQTVQRPAPAPL
ncbi:hypothetical protein EVAR_78715_1 [Eumeta japonica]|uniref:Mutator-like transposase domain-containing protein n=1 Tax=Eumeta variegata TaxID=151549 RepID=A0A4C1T108_EUMVA|nr:hypothetical protein EVAR_78715_1 [Eumeta japonica]